MRKRPSRRGNTKLLGIIVAAFFGFILLSSTVLIAVNPAVLFGGGEAAVTGTPADNYSVEDRPMFCGVSEPSFNAYVAEYGIPTPCSQPVAIEVDPVGTVWFAQGNTGNIASFHSATEVVTEYENPLWVDGTPSMIWDMDYSDGYLWYADTAYNSVWRFNTVTKEYRQFELPASGNPLPQILQVHGTDIILNDLLGNNLVVLDASDIESGLVYNSIPSNVTDAVTAGFDVAEDGTIWYTTWVADGAGILVNIHPDLIKAISPIPPRIEPLPVGLRTPNGLVVDDTGTLWLADTSSSYFFSFDPASGQFTHYMTSPPDSLSYGNITGMVQMPVSRPYWMATTDDGRIVFNEQTANRIAVFDDDSQRLVEYSIPSRNPFWSDCGGIPSCGIAQALAFDVSGTDIWFTEWVENHIGVVDTARPVPLDILPSTRTLSLFPGQSETVSYVISPSTDRPLSVEPIMAHSHTFLRPEPHGMLQLNIIEGDTAITLDIVSDDNAQPGSYKILLGAKSGPVSVSDYLTVEILPAPQ